MRQPLTCATRWSRTIASKFPLSTQHTRYSLCLWLVFVWWAINLATTSCHSICPVVCIPCGLSRQIVEIIVRRSIARSRLSHGGSILLRLFSTETESLLLVLRVGNCSVGIAGKRYEAVPSDQFAAGLMIQHSLSSPRLNNKVK